jgi:hypothetical protein
VFVVPLPAARDDRIFAVRRKTSICSGVRTGAADGACASMTATLVAAMADVIPARRRASLMKTLLRASNYTA